MVVLDVLDEVGQRGEVESAAPEAAGVGEEGGGGDACHGATSRAPRSRLCERGARRRREGPGRGQARGGQREPGTEERGREVERSAEPPGGSGRRRELGEGAGRTPRLGGGTRRAPAAVRAPTSATQASPGSARLQLYVPGPALRGARCLRSAGSLFGYVHYLLNRSTSINYTWFPRMSTQGVAGPSGGTFVCIWPPV